MLQAILNSIPGYQIRGENNDLLSYLFVSWRGLKQTQSRPWYQTAASLAPNHPWYGIDQAQADIYRAELTRAFSNAVLRPDPGIRVTGCKEIRYHRTGDDLEAYLDFIHDGFANCRFIFNTRNHNDVLKSGWWPKTSDLMSGMSCDLRPENHLKFVTRPQAKTAVFEHNHPQP